MLVKLSMGHFFASRKSSAVVSCIAFSYTIILNIKTNTDSTQDLSMLLCRSGGLLSGSSLL